MMLLVLCRFGPITDQNSTDPGQSRKSDLVNSGVWTEEKCSELCVLPFFLGNQQNAPKTPV